MPPALAATLAVAARCTFRLDELRYDYPRESVLPGLSPTQTLRRHTVAGAHERYPRGVPVRIWRCVAKELRLIAECRYEMFFLTVHDIVRFARGRGILCQGRGSAANSVVCFCLGITAADPEHGRDQALLGKLVWQPSAWQKHTFTGEYVEKKTELDLLSQYGAVSRGITTTSARGATDNGRQRLSWQGRFDLGASWADTVRTTLAYQRFRSEEQYDNTRVGVPGQVRDTLDHENTLQANVQFEKTLRGGALAHKLAWGLDAMRIGADNLQTGVTPPAGETFPLKRFPDTTETSYGVFRTRSSATAGA